MTEEDRKRYEDLAMVIRDLWLKQEREKEKENNKDQ